MIDCIIVDDELHVIDILQSYVEKIPYLHLIESTTNPLRAIEIVNAQKIDLIFLDVQMPEISGIDFIKAINNKSKIILVTAYSNYALDGFDLNVVDYLLKPVTFPRFLQAVQKVLNNVTALPIKEDEIGGFFFVKSEVKGKMIKINFDEIDYIESLKNYVAIHCGDKKVLALQTLRDVENKLPKNKFMRIHRSFIVDLTKIDKVEGNSITLKKIKADILLGETFKAEFLEKIKNSIL